MKRNRSFCLVSSHHQSSADVPSATKFLLLILVLSLHVQCSGQKEVDKEKLQQKVRDEFLHSWNSYKNSHISGGIDSYYEYLYKCWLLFDDKDCHTMWKGSIAALNKYLADQRPTGLWYGTVNMETGERVATKFGALDAFFPAVLALSGDLSRARALQQSSYAMWTKFGIEPEEIDYSTMKITYDGYPLRPEIMESAYYLYYFTNDPVYLKMGETFLKGLRKYCRTRRGYAALVSVETKEKRDSMESYFLAETLKYLYLLFAPRETLDLSKFVFNTEAHPIRK
ncbi:glycoside hydrolase family 47 protein [bacterium]|nr:glycoside hydrolase family 47 protein [bacterium]